MTVLIVIACHFKSKTELCATTIKRLEAALAASRRYHDPRFFVTGNVPYEKGGKPMSVLMLGWLASRGIERRKIHIGDGVGTFSEARHVIDSAFPGSNIIVVSSNWYLWSGRPIWRRQASAARSGLRVTFLSVRGTGSLRTKLFYAAYGIIVNLSFLFGRANRLEERLTAMQSKRTEGFTWDGCGAHPAGH